MVRTTVIFYAIILAELLAENVLFVGFLGLSRPPEIVKPIVVLTTAAVCGTFSNRWYLSHALKKIAEVRSYDLREEAYMRLLTDCGGTNFGVAVFAFLIFVALASVLNFVLIVVLNTQ
jgi:hypothetical protein